VKKLMPAENFMQRALFLARKGEGTVSPNPLVGAVIVKGKKVIAEGYHKKCGWPHAEIEAIRKAKPKDLKGATLYINLEPCCHFGKTPPCVDEIIRRKFRKVIIAVKDPNPKVNGKSIKKLKQAGIKVSLGSGEKEALRLNEIFFKNMQQSLPFVVVKVAQSLDGKIATATGQSKWITSEKSRQVAKSLRDKYDAVLVGVNTIVKDNPSLKGLKRTPFKIVIDPNLRIPRQTFVLKNHPEKLIVITSLSNKKKAQKISKAVKLIFLKKEKSGQFPIRSILKALYHSGIMSVFVEGGAETIGRFFDAKAVDRVFIFIAPKIIGGRNALASVGGKGVLSISSAISLRDVKIEKIGSDFLISGKQII